MADKEKLFDVFDVVPDTKGLLPKGVLLMIVPPIHTNLQTGKQYINPKEGCVILKGEPDGPDLPGKEG